MPADTAWQAPHARSRAKACAVVPSTNQLGQTSGHLPAAPAPGRCTAGRGPDKRPSEPWDAHRPRPARSASAEPAQPWSLGSPAPHVVATITPCLVAHGSSHKDDAASCTAAGNHSWRHRCPTAAAAVPSPQHAGLGASAAPGHLGRQGVAGAGRGCQCVPGGAHLEAQRGQRVRLLDKHLDAALGNLHVRGQAGRQAHNGGAGWY